MTTMIIAVLFLQCLLIVGGILFIHHLYKHIGNIYSKQITLSVDMENVLEQLSYQRNDFHIIHDTLSNVLTKSDKDEIIKIGSETTECLLNAQIDMNQMLTNMQMSHNNIVNMLTCNEQSIKSILNSNNENFQKIRAEIEALPSKTACSWNRKYH